MRNSTTTSKSRLANRRPAKVTNLELNANPPLQYNVARLPSWKNIDANLRSIKEFFLPLGGHNFDVKDLHWRTKLHKAALMGYESVVEYMVLHGANIHAQDNEGVTPLGVANRLGYQNLTRIMLRKQHDVVEEETRRKKDGHFKLAFALLNVGMEICKVALFQETAFWYRRVGVALAFVCLMLSVFEMVYETKRDGVEWKKRGRWCYWFYYPGRVHVKAFGNFMLWFGLVSSTLQFCVSLASLKIKREVLKFDYMGLLLSIFYLMALVGGRDRTMSGVMKCDEHGDCKIEGRVKQGRWIFDCIHCRMEKLV